MDIKKQLGKRIREIRKKKGYTQEKLAELINIEPPSLSYIETGKFAPAVETLQKISEILETDIWEFYYFENRTHEDMVREITEAMKEDENLTKMFYSLFKTVSYIK